MMSSFFRIVFWSAAALAIATVACFRVSAFSSYDSAVIVNSGSTNSPGVQVVVERSGNGQ